MHLEGPPGAESRSGRTDSCGAVAFDGLPNGIYSVKAVDGLLEGMVENVAVSRGKDEMVDVKLNGQATGADPIVKSASPCTRVRLLSGGFLGYTSDALQRNVQGCLVVKCVITSNGMVRNCQAIEPLEGLTKHSMRELERTRFEPAMCEGKPVDIDNTFWLTTLGGPDGKTTGLEPYVIKG